MSKPLKSQQINREEEEPDSVRLYCYMKKKIELYEPDGWINIQEIDRLGTWCNVIIGPRQVGKTYGTLKQLITERRMFSYWRRSEDELEFITKNPKYNPFRALRKEGLYIDIVRAGKHDYRIGNATYDEKGQPKLQDEIATGTALLTVAKLRSFDGSAYTDIVFDEFIPEQIVIQRKAEGDACVNGYITFAGNRELEGKPPLKLWLLANANSIKSPILSAWGLLPAVERLMRSQQEYLITDSNVLVAMPRSEKIIDKRNETAAMRHLRKVGGAVYGMAAENRFAYDDLQSVRPQSLKGMKPLMQVAGLFIYEHTGSLYVCGVKHNKRPIYGDTVDDSIRCQMDNPMLRQAYFAGYVYFDSAQSLIKFRDFFNIKD